MSLSTREIKEILTILENSGWEEARIVIGDVTLTVAKGAGGLLPPADGAAAPPAPGAPAAPQAQPQPEPEEPAPATAAAEPEAPAEAPPAEAGGETITSPSVGIFWRAPEPGAQPFVEEGQDVQPGDTLCIVEVMKLMNHVACETAGTITAIHVENGEHVEHGTPLFSIAPG